MKYCIIENNVVTNVIEISNDEDAKLFNAVYLGEEAAIGDVIINGVISGKSIQSDSALMANRVRETRNKLLADTDWWALTDHVMTPEQTAYRQALRDITTQDGFPNNVIYPPLP
jgi:hypothetical protein